jgi:hypothetical protein
MAATPRPLADIARGIAAALPRRRFLAGFATLAAATGAPLLGARPAPAAAPAIAMPAAPPDDRDRRLGELVDRYNAAQREFDAAFAQECAAGERMAAVAPPPALDMDIGDRWFFAPRRVDRIRLREVEEIRAQILREAEEDDADYARTPAARARRARMLAIVAAWEGWERAQDREAERSGYAAAFRRRLSAGRRVASLRAAIVDSPATTPFGLLAKLAIGADGFGDDEIAESLARQRTGGGASAGAVLVSALRDWRALFPGASALA